jgi:flagellar hook-length control protein FliK
MKTQSATSTGSTQSTSQQQPPPKTDSKAPQKEFKKVLDDKAEPRGKSAPQGKMKGGLMKQEGAGAKTEHMPLTSAGRKPISAKHDADDAGEMGFSKKHEKTKQTEKKEDLKPFSVPTTMMMGPTTVHGKAEVQKAHGPSALNIREIESIVQKAQVGINEKGLPEMNFELITDKLGPLTLKISSDQDKVKIQFVTQDAAAQNELQKGMTELSQLLGQRGLNLSETNVMTRDQQSQQQQQDRGREDRGSSAMEGTGKSRAKKRVISGPSDDGFTI